MAQSPDNSTVHIDIQGVSRFLTTFSGLLEGNQNIGLINVVIEQLCLVLHQHGLSDCTDTSMSDDILSYLEWKLIAHSSSLEKNSRAKAQGKNFYRNSHLATYYFDNVSLAPCIEFQTLPMASVRKETLRTSQSESFSDYEETNWTTAGNANESCYHSLLSLSDKLSKRESKELDPVRQTRFRTSTFSTGCYSEAQVSGFHTGSPIAERAHSLKLELPSSASLRLNGTSSLSSNPLHKAKCLSPMARRPLDDESSSACVPPENYEVPCTPPEMWSLHFSSV